MIGATESAKRQRQYNWGFFLRRLSAALIVGGVWTIERIEKHDPAGVAWAVGVCFLAAPIVAYVWTRRS